jgi:hypothetical protein
MKAICRAKFRTAWLEGVSGYVMAQTFGIARSTVLRHVKNYGLPLRPRGQRSAIERRTPTTENNA